MTLTLITSQPQLSSGAVPRSIQCTLCYNHGHVINYWADRCILHHFYPTSYLEPHLKPLLKLWSFDGIEVHLFVVIIMIIIIATTIKSGQRIKMKGVIIVLSPIAAANAFLWPWPHLINCLYGPTWSSCHKAFRLVQPVFAWLMNVTVRDMDRWTYTQTNHTTPYVAIADILYNMCNYA